PLWVLQLPVLVALAGEERTGVAATHRDHHIRGPERLVGDRLRELLAQVDAELRHRRDSGRIDLLSWARAGRADGDAPVRAQLDQAGGHLAAARVVRADEQHLRLLLRNRPLDLCHRVQPLRGDDREVIDAPRGAQSPQAPRRTTSWPATE